MQGRKIAIFTSLIVTVLTPNIVHAKADDQMSLSEQQRELRLQHARELLGKYYRKSAVRKGEDVRKINTKIYTYTRDHLPKKYHRKYQVIAQAIIDEALKHEFDPVFVLSVIQRESKFNPNELGSLDEIGLMQLRPATAEWIAQKYGIKWRGKQSLHDPIENIRLGTAYMDYLRGRFDNHARLYISAYNMGKRNVDRNLAEDVWPKEYAGHVMRVYVEFYENLRSATHAKKRNQSS